MGGELGGLLSGRGSRANVGATSLLLNKWRACNAAVKGLLSRFPHPVRDTCVLLVAAPDQVRVVVTASKCSAAAFKLWLSAESRARCLANRLGTYEVLVMVAFWKFGFPPNSTACVLPPSRCSRLTAAAHLVQLRDGLQSCLFVWAIACASTNDLCLMRATTRH